MDWVPFFKEAIRSRSKTGVFGRSVLTRREASAVL
jgi:hypothetical protein